MLVCVAGKGWYQEEGKPAVQMVPGENCSNEWLEPVSDEEYESLSVKGTASGSIPKE